MNNRTNNQLLVLTVTAILIILSYGIIKAIDHHYKVESMIAELEIFGNQ